ncbi:MAG: KAP family NTPase [Lachnospiraceae bacterium]|nr:KAP family NTPase [Lachnospiraceae bacterium]
MYSNEIESVITEYLRNPKAEYAVMIDGDWGSGKTYFLTHSLIKIMETIDNGKEKRRKYAYVSLYGAKSIDDVSKEIVFQCFGKKHKKKVETADTVMETASNILTASLGVVNIDLSKIKDTLAKIDINNWIICFDDLERCCLPINEILGYMNRLVEHNGCKVIVLANEKEIGKVTLNQRLENKYQVVLSGRKLLLNKGDNSTKNEENEGIDIESLQKRTKMLFNEDILYKSIREKVIGLTIKYEPQMDVVYDSLISDYSNGGEFKKYLQKNKEKVLKYFAEEECCNLRTLICVLGSIQKVYDEMTSNKYDTVKYFDKIMEVFLKYIVLFTIYFKNGGKVSDLKLTTEIGYVQLGQDIFSHTRGFKCLEKFCTTLSFSEEEFARVVSALRQEYEEEERRIEKSKEGLAQAYGELAYWWEKEDDDVARLIIQIRKEVEQDKYPFNSYQGIIGQLMVLEYWGYNIGDMDALIDVMNQNIERTDEIVDIERFSFSFESNLSLQNRYDEYINKLKLKAGNKNQVIKASEVTLHLPL